MPESLKFLLGVLQEALGGITGEWIKKVGVPAVIVTLLYAAWDLAVSPIGPMVFVNCLGVFAVGLLIFSRIQERRLQKKLERGDLTPLHCSTR
jgi:hypothetical protein